MYVTARCHAEGHRCNMWLQYGANAMMVDHEKRDALWYAQRSGNKQCEQLVLTQYDAGVVAMTGTLPRQQRTSSSSNSKTPTGSANSSHSNQQQQHSNELLSQQQNVESMHASVKHF